MSDDILTRNFFELFGIPVAYDIDLNAIQPAYMALQAQVHPDRFATAGDAEKRLAMQQTSHVNEALHTLKDPVLRAAYLLGLKGMDIHLENETTMDAAFLMQQLELREAMANIRKQSAADNEDRESLLDRLDDMRGKINRDISSVMNDFSAAYESGQLDDARELVRKLQFLQKAKKEVESLSAKIEDALMS